MSAWSRSTCLGIVGLVSLLGLACGSSVPAVGGDGGVDVAPPAPDTRPDPDTALPPPSVTTVDDGDGVAVVGEVVLLQGKSFGPNCEVQFGSVKARRISVSQVELRFQVPEGIPVGAAAPLLVCDNGSTSFSLQVRRYHPVTLPGLDKVALLEENSPGGIVDSGQRLTFADADTVALSDDSAVAYVASAKTATGSPHVGIVDLTASGGPQLLQDELPIVEPVKLPNFSVATAADAPVLALAGGLYVVLYDIADPRVPKRLGTIQSVALVPGTTLPQVNAGFFIDVALSPDGKTAVLLDGAADELWVHDIAKPDSPVLVGNKIKVSAGSSAKPMVNLPWGISGMLGLLKVQGGSAQDLALSADGKRAAVLAGGGVGALVPESFNLDLHNTTLTVVDLPTGSYLNELEQLTEANIPNNVGFAPGGDAYVTSLSSASVVLLKILFEIGVKVLTGGGLDLTSITSLLFTNFFDVLDVVKSTWDGTLFHLGGLHHVVNNKAGPGSFARLPEIQAGLCTTYDGTRLVATGQGWVVDIDLGPTIVEDFVFRYDLGVTVHDLAANSHAYHSLEPWHPQLLLPPWSFGHVACQQ
jgi:hypothetical protein